MLKLTLGDIPIIVRLELNASRIGVCCKGASEIGYRELESRGLVKQTFYFPGIGRCFKITEMGEAYLKALAENKDFPQ